MKTKTHKPYIYKRVLLAVVASASVLFSIRLEATPHKEPSRQFAKAFLDKIRQPSHKTHIRFIERCDDCNKDCTDCHALDKKTDSYTLNRYFCKKCHLPSPPPAWKIPIKARKMKGVAFRHSAHERDDRGVAIRCRECHESTIEDDHINNQPLVAPERCFSCHADNRVEFSERNCDRCHWEKRKYRIEPPSHDQRWGVTHGEDAKWNRQTGHEKQCTLCHQNAACVACHRTESPRSHNGAWRVRMHGTAAEWDRDRCKTCHETGACVSCHKRVAPITHRGNWLLKHGRVAGFEDRCTVCHNPGWCTNCHRGSKQR